ncbi:hypothetical protein [Prolixibacter sp. SD074]|nr:hypothetical protein [Prolixibacter sp. SD074]GET28984.1 hypothetical protein SD074_11860 [Prolixibacter sp. SD074]
MKANNDIEELIDGLQLKQLKEREEAFHQMYALLGQVVGNASRA